MKQETTKPRLFKSAGQWGCYRPGGTVMTFGSTPKIAYDGWAWEERHWARYHEALTRPVADSQPQSFFEWLFDDFIKKVPRRGYFVTSRAALDQPDCPSGLVFERMSPWDYAAALAVPVIAGLLVWAWFFT